MDITSREHCGLLAMAELARREARGPVPLRDIAAAQGISMKYLEQIIPCLRAAGLVASTRGARGGYALSRAPGQITVGDVLRALGGGVLSLRCAGEAKSSTCAREGSCIVRPVWVTVHQQVLETVDGMTLADLRSREQEGQNSREAAAAGSDT
jgi:Rrf2 family protein